MDTKKVLILDRDKAVADIVCNTLKKEGFDVKTNWQRGSKLTNVNSHTIPSISSYFGLKWQQDNLKLADYSAETILENEPDIILLDTTLVSYDDGFDLCKRIREISNVPIIMFSGKDSEEAIILALELGADDYITQPFSLKELVARVNSLIRRAGMPGYYPD